MLEGLIPSVGTVGDALDNGLCETTIGLYKTECVREGSPFRSRADPHPGRPGGHHLGVGGLVQRTQADAPPPPPPTRGGRGRVLRSISTPESTPVTRNEVCMKPGMLHLFGELRVSAVRDRATRL